LIKLRRQAIDVLDQMGKQIAAELTPEQRVTYEKILQERRESRELRGARHRGDRPPPGAGGPPPDPRDHPVLPVEVGRGPLLDGGRDLLHAGIAGILLQDPGTLDEPVEHGHEAAGERDLQRQVA